MPSDRSVPRNPLEFIQRCVREGKVLWTYHVNMRLQGRFIRRADIFKAIERCEMVEEYPDDKYLPSYLVMGQHGRKAIHIVVAVDLEENHVRIVTAYHPDPGEWEAGFRKRRKLR